MTDITQCHVDSQDDTRQWKICEEAQISGQLNMLMMQQGLSHEKKIHHPT